MSFEVAAVHATLGFKVEGAQDATAAARTIDRAIQELSESVNSSSAIVRESANELRDAITAYNDVAAATANARQAMQENGQTVADLNDQISSLKDEINALGSATNDLSGYTDAQVQLARQAANSLGGLEAATQANIRVLDSLGQQVGLTGDQLKDLLKRMEEMGTGAGGAAAKVKELEKELSELEKQRNLVSFKDLISAEADIERSTNSLKRARRGAGELAGAQRRLSSTTRNLNGNFRLNQTMLSGLVSTMRSGRVSTTLFSQALRPLAGMLASVASAAVGVAAAIVAIPFLAVAGGWKLLNSEWGKAADRLNSLEPEIVATARAMDTLSNSTSTGDLAAALDMAQRRFESFGISERQASEISRRIAKAADFAQHLPGAGSFDQTFQDIQRAVETLNFSNLRDLGIDVNQLESELQTLAEQGFSQAERQGAALNMIMGELAGKSNDVADAMRRDHNTLEELKEDMAALFNAAKDHPALKAAIESLVAAFREWLPLIAGVAKGMLLVALGIAKAAAFFADLIDKGWMFFGLVGAIAKGIKELGENELDDLGFDDLETEIANITGGIDDMFDEVVEGTEKGKDAFREFRDSLNISAGIEGQLRGIGQAFADLQDGLDPGEVTSYVEQLSSGLDMIAERGVENVQRSFDALEDLLRQSFDAGLLSAEEFQTGLDELEAKRGFADVLIRQVEDMEDKFGEGQSAIEGATSALDGTREAAGSATSRVDDLSNALLSIPSEVGTNIHVGISGPGAAFLSGGPVSVGGGIPVTNPTTGEVTMMTRGPRSASSQGAGNVTTAVPGTPGGIPTDRFRDSSASIGADRGLINRAKEVEAANAISAIEEFNRSRGIAARSRGGGGGGGGGNDLASIEQIREFFRQVNAVILSGIRGGTIFSTAGNAIPVGSASEFLNTRGGALIQTVNIRGVWDFADPAAKRQIIKELEESLAGLKREVA